MLTKIIVDADLCIKLGQSDKYRFLEEVLPLVSQEIYMHSYTYSEVRMPRSAVSQLEALKSSGKIIVVNENSLEPADKLVYDIAYKNLASVMIDPRNPNKNKGETCSLAYAKATGIPIFATDETGLQSIIDNQLNTGIDDITCLRIINIIEMIRHGEIALSRKTAKAIWRLAGHDNESFDTSIWPLQDT